MGHQDFGLRGELHPAPGLAKQFDAGLLFQEGQLLGDRGGAVLERLGDFGQGAPNLQFAQQAQPPDIQHRYSFVNSDAY